jgi:glycerol-3-phosphate O-acyltransferase/dihydroxyacetone phosphate acyltransferase
LAVSPLAQELTNYSAPVEAIQTFQAPHPRQRPLRRAADWGMTNLARLLIRVFFRRVEVQNGDHLPKSGPLVLVANHTNGLVDGLLLMATLGRYPRFLGKSTLFRIPPLWPFLKLAGVIPVYRAIDGVSPVRNASAFAASHDLLDHGGMVALFPEGISHDELSVQPLRTGAARIALEAGVDGGVEDVVTVAVGLTYDAKARFRSRALVRVAEPVGISGWADAYRSDGHDAVRQLTKDLGDQLASVSPTYPSWSQVEQLSRLADVLVRRPGEHLSPEVSMADRMEIADQLAVVERRLPASALVHTLLSVFTLYERDLALLGLDDAQLIAKYAKNRLRRSLAWSVLKILLAVPFAAIGVVVHVIPFQIIKQLAKQPSNEGIKATVKLLGCTAAFVLVYAALGLAAGLNEGAWAGLLVAAAAPACGYVAVRLSERVKRIGGVVEGYRTVTARNAVIDTVIIRRKAVVDAARSVLAMR